MQKLTKDKTITLNVIMLNNRTVNVTF